MSFFAQFREVQAGQRPSASQYNQLLRLVKQIASSLMANGMFSPGTGFVTRRGLAGGPGSVIRLATAQESAQGDEFISVKLLNADGDETGAAFDVQGLMVGSGSALNECVPRIVSADILPVFKANDGDWYFTTVFQPVIECVCTEPSE